LGHTLGSFGKIKSMVMEFLLHQMAWFTVDNSEMIELKALET
jgi:hypothetical protein